MPVPAGSVGWSGYPSKPVPTWLNLERPSGTWTWASNATANFPYDACHWYCHHPVNCHAPWFVADPDFNNDEYCVICGQSSNSSHRASERHKRRVMHYCADAPNWTLPKTWRRPLLALADIQHSQLPPLPPPEPPVGHPHGSPVGPPPGPPGPPVGTKPQPRRPPVPEVTSPPISPTAVVSPGPQTATMSYFNPAPPGVSSVAPVVPHKAPPPPQRLAVVTTAVIRIEDNKNPQQQQVAAQLNAGGAKSLASSSSTAGSAQLDHHRPALPASSKEGSAGQVGESKSDTSVVVSEIGHHVSEIGIDVFEIGHDVS